MPHLPGLVCCETAAHKKKACNKHSTHIFIPQTTRKLTVMTVCLLLQTGLTAFDLAEWWKRSTTKGNHHFKLSNQLSSKRPMENGHGSDDQLGVGSLVGFGRWWWLVDCILCRLVKGKRTYCGSPPSCKRRQWTGETGDVAAASS